MLTSITTVNGGDQVCKTISMGTLRLLAAICLHSLNHVESLETSIHEVITRDVEQPSLTSLVHFDGHPQHLCSASINVTDTEVGYEHGQLYPAYKLYFSEQMISNRATNSLVRHSPTHTVLTWL